jgi:hypothetical protein
MFGRRWTGLQAAMKVKWGKVRRMRAIAGIRGGNGGGGAVVGGEARIDFEIRGQQPRPSGIASPPWPSLCLCIPTLGAEPEHTHTPRTRHPRPRDAHRPGHSTIARLFLPSLLASLVKERRAGQDPSIIKVSKTKTMRTRRRAM